MPKTKKTAAKPAVAKKETKTVKAKGKVHKIEDFDTDSEIDELLNVSEEVEEVIAPKKTAKKAGKVTKTKTVKPTKNTGKKSKVEELSGSDAEVDAEDLVVDDLEVDDLEDLDIDVEDMSDVEDLQEELADGVQVEHDYNSGNKRFDRHNPKKNHNKKNRIDPQTPIGQLKILDLLIFTENKAREDANPLVRDSIRDLRFAITSGNNRPPFRNFKNNNQRFNQNRFNRANNGPFNPQSNGSNGPSNNSRNKNYNSTNNRARGAGPVYPPAPSAKALYDDSE